jgi:TonB family protein
MKFSCILSLLLFACWAPRAAGQHYLAVKEGEKMSVVVAAHGLSPLVLHGDKLEEVHAMRFALGQGGEYLPLFVAIRHPEVRTTSLSMDGHDINKEFHLYCELETAYSLKHVFVVIVLHLGNDSGLFLFEVADLEPRDPRPFNVKVPMDMESQLGSYDLYMFSGGRELFHSLMPMGVADSALDRMVRERIKDVKDSAVKPLVGPAPEYPKALYRKRVDGHATVSFTIDARGAVGDPVILSASLPEFGESALAAIRLWRFLPKVKHEQPVESRAEMPFEFTSPKNK